jgi:hypothetical protein
MHAGSISIDTFKDVSDRSLILTRCMTSLSVKEQGLRFHLVDEHRLSGTLPKDVQNLGAVPSNADEQPDRKKEDRRG